MQAPFEGGTPGASQAALPIASRHTPTSTPGQSGWFSPFVLTQVPVPQSPSSQQYFAQPFLAAQP